MLCLVRWKARESEVSDDVIYYKGCNVCDFGVTPRDKLLGLKVSYVLGKKVSVFECGELQAERECVGESPGFQAYENYRPPCNVHPNMYVTNIRTKNGLKPLFTLFISQ